MKYNYYLRIISLLFMLTLFFILIFYQFDIYKTKFKEPLTQNNKIVLIGDSILNNSKYVPIGNSVFDNLKLKHGNNVILLAKDNATIETCYNQLLSGNNTIINNENYNLYISIGGNNILNEFNKNENINEENLKKIFKKYEDLIKKIKNKYSKTNIYIFNLYFPPDKKYKQIIEKWNNLIETFQNKTGKNNNYILLRLDNLLTNKNDFVYDVEPSSIGSKKIADLIFNS